MTRLLVAAGLLVCAAAPAASVQPPPAPAADLRIDVVVLDERGDPVADVRPGELEVWISGYRVPIDAVYAVQSAPRLAVLLLDDAAIAPGDAIRVKEAARSFVAGMREGDRVAVVTLDRLLADFTADRSVLLAAIDGYAVRGFPVHIEDAGARVLRGMEALAKRFPETATGRKTIVAIGAAWLFDRPMPTPGYRDLQEEWVAAMRAMAAANSSLYVVDPLGMRVDGPVDSGSQGFARETGGRAFVNTNDIAGAVRRIWAEAGSYYLLAMKNPPVQRGAALRQVEVRVLRKGLSVEARRGIKGTP